MLKRAKEPLTAPNKNCKRVLIITPFYLPSIGGAESFAKHLYDAVSKKDDCFVCHLQNKITWKGFSLFKGFSVIPKLFMKARKETKWRNPDTIISLGLNAGFVAYLLKFFFEFRHLNINLCLYDFKKRSWLFKRFAQIVYNSALYVFVEGQRCWNDTIEYISTPYEYVHKYQHWCDQEHFKRIRRKYALPITVLFVGRPIPEKGIRIIRRVESRFKNTTKKIQFLYVQNLDYSQIRDVYQAADILVIPSLYEESFTRVAVEAASCGCAVIASNNGSLPEQVSPFGKVIQPRTDDFYNVINGYLKNKRKLIYWKNKAYRYSQKHFTEKNAEVILRKI